MNINERLMKAIREISAMTINMASMKGIPNQLILVESKRASVLLYPDTYRVIVAPEAHSELAPGYILVQEELQIP